MPNIGPLELVVVLIIALVVFGPKRLPELGRSLGRGIREFRGSVSGDNKDDDDEPRELEQSKADAPESVEGEVVTEKRA
jgi:sec-independent protein translocase protein TatA